MYLVKGFKRPCRGGGRGSHVACRNFKTSRVSVYKCLSLIVGFAVTVAIWPREVVPCRNFILRAVATFWAMSLVGIYPGPLLMIILKGNTYHFINSFQSFNSLFIICFDFLIFLIDLDHLLLQFSDSVL